MNQWLFRSSGLLLCGIAYSVLPLDYARAADKLIYDRDVRPVLSDTCFKCHGFDANKRRADLRLDTLAGATKDLGEGRVAISPGHPEHSEAYTRLTSDDPEEKMPPPKSGIVLTPEQVATLKQWIAEGAEYQPHWALVAPVEQALPEVKQKDWARNAIDTFVLARLEKENLSPSPEADRETLIRRVTLDLTGLPPTPSEVDSFLSDQSPDAYERVVDRLLASPRYGERMALWWLDLARYGDTNGYQNDTERAQWRYRDWVIDAFNRNEPFNQFTVDQIAGDLIPNAKLDQKIASGFNRNHRITIEGGVIPEEARTEYVIDRLETTATTWLGLTMGCARCHDHKYDPILQKDFYRFFAFFNQVPENGIDGRDYNSVPFIPAPVGVENQKKLQQLDASVAAVDAAVNAIEPEIQSGIAAWEQTLPRGVSEPALRKGLIAHLPLDGTLADTVAFYRPLDFRVSDAVYTPGVLSRGVDFDGKRVIDVPETGNFERTDAFSFGAWVYARDGANSAVIAKMDESKNEIGYNLYWLNGQVFVQLMHDSKNNDLLSVVTPTPVSANAWHHLFATTDGSGKAAGTKLYVDGKPVAMTVSVDTLKSTIKTDVPLRIGGRSPGATHFNGLVDDVRIYDRELKPDEVAKLGGVAILAANVPAARRTPEQAAMIRQAYLDQGPAVQRETLAKAVVAQNERQQFVAQQPTVMVMSDAAVRDTFVLKRGQYDQPSEKVTAGVPGVLPPLPDGVKADRLALANWLVAPSQPLTARVTVNRFWENYFGGGIVKSSEDFGMQSEWPSHPELLDWLAVDFMKTGWDVKAMQKLIVTSATYRQSAKVTPELLEKDPADRLLARMPRLRLSAEEIRDQALSVSGLLVEKLGGPSVKPYQPPLIWEELTSGAATGLTGQAYVQDHGDALFRRSMYSFWKRTVPLPTLTVFDAPSRELCTVRRSRTNTPLQALALLNDTIFAESARKLAERSMNEGGVKPVDRISHAFRVVTARKPTDKELKVLLDGFNFQLSQYFSDPDAAAKRVTIGESTKNPNLDPRELAAYTSVASVILNLDQTITRE